MSTYLEFGRVQLFGKVEKWLWILTKVAYLKDRLWIGEVVLL